MPTTPTRETRAAARTSGGHHLRLLIWPMLVLAAMAIDVNLTPPAATAGTGLRYTVVDSDNDPYAGIYLRDGTTMSNVRRVAERYMSYGTTVELICGANGEAVGPYANRRWHNVKVTSGPTVGQVGWIADRYLNTPNLANQSTPGEPECSATTPPPANQPAATYVSKGAPMYLCVNTANTAGCRPSGMPSVSPSQTVTMVCWKKGSWYTGDYRTDMWFWVTGPSGEGYVSASVVRNQTTVSSCDAKPGFVAAEAAAARVGQTTASTADRALFADSEWKPGPTGEWAGDCPKLPYLGWHAAGVRIAKANAINNYNTYKANVRTTGAPPRGAVVFYNTALPFGHEAISLGNGYVATTRGLDGSGKANETVPYRTFSNYLGWYLPR